MNKRVKKFFRTMATTITDDFEAKLIQTATEYQQNYYEISSDWNRYEKDEHEYIKDFIGYGLFSDPNYGECKENAKNTEEKANNEHLYNLYNEDQRKIIISIYDKVIEYGISEQSEGIVLCGIIYNVIYNKRKPLSSPKSDEKKDEDTKNEWEEKEEKSKVDELEPVEQVYPVPVFRVRQYLSSKTRKENEATKKPNIEKIHYIDSSGRVYDGFSDYLAHNVLPECTMVVPKDGRYQADPVSCVRNATQKEKDEEIVTKVWVEVLASPASNAATKVLAGGDVASTVITVASMGVEIASMLTPLGPAVITASTVGAGVSALWSIGRSAQQLADRGQHGESINVTDKAALGAWIGIAGGTMGMAATGGTMLLSRAVRTGTTVGRAAIVAHDAVLIGNLIINGVGAGFKSWDMVSNYMKDGTTPSPTEVFFLTTHIFFFCNSVMNIRLAQSFIDNSQKQLLADYEASLRSNRHRKEFQRLARNTRAAGTNDISSNEEIIRGINRIDNRDEFFQSLVRNRKAFSASGAKVSFVDGKVTVNSVMTIDPIEFAKLPKDVRVDIVKGVSSISLPSSSTVKQTAGHVNNEVSYKNFTASNKNVLKDFCAQHSSALLQTASVAIGDYENVLNDLYNVRNSTEIFMRLLSIGYQILQAMPREETTVGNILSTIVQFVWDYVKMSFRNVDSGIMLEDPGAKIILDKLLTEFLYHVVKKVDVWVRAFREWLENKFRQKIGGSGEINDAIVKLGKKG